ncbi:hypothetical protein CspHIS471_0301230 [Cutaneotrichosporon sp. HIS471]|nr:hypothetical protein CspHIS471_0301230 [Cutaneotrichosporon sp. HIS471]
MRIFARMTNITLTGRGNPFWFENADGDAYDEPSVYDVINTGGRVRVVMKSNKYKPPGKGKEPEPKAPASKAKSPAKATATKAPAPKATKAPGKVEKPKNATKGLDAITGELYLSDARDKCRATWSHTNRELIVPWTDTAEGVLRIFAFIMGYKVGSGKSAIQCETRAGMALPDPTMRQIMDAGKMVKVSIKRGKE